MKQWPRMRHGDSNGPRASADVGDGLRPVLREQSKRCLDQNFGLGTRDKDGWREGKAQAVELLLAEDVLDGLMVPASAQKLVVIGDLGRGERHIRVRQQPGA